MKKLILACLLLFPTQAIAENVCATAYFSKPLSIMASGERINQSHYKNTIALSWDIGRKYKFGDLFQLTTKDGTFLVRYSDRMPAYHRNKVDFLMSSNKECKKWGKQKGNLQLIRRK
jgi:3D (Asp-Asp-Asp) domain-containing protein